MNLGTARVIRADARHLPLEDNSVDLVITSPPYFALRSYQDGGQHYAGQIGDEPTPAEFVDSLLEVTRECMRVLKPSGSLWVNLGDKYASNGPSGPQGSTGQRADRSQAATYAETARRQRKVQHGIREKSLIGIPWRYALRCIDDLGLILRAEVIWSKPNGLPESVTDRVRRSHEQWFYFEQSRGVEADPQGFPFCALCGRPVDARSTLVRRLKEVESGPQPLGVPDHVGQDGGSESANTSGRHHNVAVRASVAAVPAVGVGNPERVEQAVQLVEDGVVTAVNHDPQDGPTVAGMPHQGDGALAVDESSEPSGVCQCEGHALTLNDEPWIPQALAAELMQMVADGDADAQNVADFLSGDYARTHSTWFHFTLSPRYFSAVDEIREEVSPDPNARGLPKPQRSTGPMYRGGNGQFDHRNRMQANPLGKLPGSVWTVPTEPLRVPDHLGVDHFAAFPTTWPKRIIQGWSPAGVCVECGEGRRPVVASVGLDMSRPQARRAQELADRAGLTEDHLGALLSVGVSDTGRGAATQSGTGKNTAEVYRLAGEARDALGGYSREYLLRRPTGFTYACACPEPTAPTRPALVLDPFGGTGTTAMVAKALGRDAVSVDMSADYCRLAEWRCNDRNQLAKVLGIEKASPVHPDEGNLLDLIEGGAA